MRLHCVSVTSVTAADNETCCQFSVSGHLCSEHLSPPKNTIPNICARRNGLGLGVRGHMSGGRYRIETWKVEHLFDFPSFYTIAPPIAVFVNVGALFDINMRRTPWPCCLCLLLPLLSDVVTGSDAGRIARRTRKIAFHNVVAVKLSGPCSGA